MTVHCPSCGKKLTVPDNTAGRKARCTGCASLFVIAIEQPVAAPQGAPCPRCGQRIGPADEACPECGFLVASHLPAGPVKSESLRVRVPEPEEVEEEELSGWLKAVELFSQLMPGVFRPAMVVVALILAAVAVGVMLIGAWIATIGAVMEGLMIGGFGLIIYAQGAALLLYGDWGLLHEALSELDGRRWTLFLLLLILPMAAMTAVIRYYFTH